MQTGGIVVLEPDNGEMGEVKLNPYYQDEIITIYNADCFEIMKSLGRFDLMLTDPPYGIGRDKGMGGGGGGLAPRKRLAKKYSESFDNYKPDMTPFISMAEQSIIWGGNYLTLPQSNKWLVWDKQNTMPSYSDAELAWTNLPNNAVKMYRYCNNGMLGKEKGKMHPNQKPIQLIKWCIKQAGEPKNIIDPFAGSGSTGRAAKDMRIQCTLIEKSEMYCEVAAKRMNQEIIF